VSGLSREVLLGFAAGAITIVAIAIAVVLLHGTGRSNDDQSGSVGQAMNPVAASEVAEPTVELTTTPNPSESAGEPVANPTAPAATAPPPEPQIDSLFLIYICNQRNDPAYPAALEKWGYLTHGGKELMCLEYHHGNLEFVLHHQGLIENSAHQQLEQFPVATNPYGFVLQHDDMPDAWFQNVVWAAGLNPHSTFGEWLLQRFTYTSADAWLQSLTSDSAMLTNVDLAEFMMEYVDRESSSLETDSSALGDQLSRTLTGTPESYLSRRLLRTHRPENQQSLISSLISVALIGFSPRREVGLSGQYDAMWNLFISHNWQNPNLRFDEFLLLNSERFLEQYWSGRDWTPRSDYR
jgi:hypothetical protein